MAELNLGTKHECTSCGTKFYDLGKPKKICPSCGVDQDADADADQEAGDDQKKK